ncbi:kinase-like protein, partial [Lophium mytilinum]
GSYTDRRYFGVLMVPVAEHSLTDFLASSEQHVRHRITLGTFFGCLASALHYLHQNQIRHRDIKPDNILVKGAGVYLTDFGISLDWQQLSRSTTDEASGLTYNYCAPEVLDPDQKRNSRTDIWSLGCVFMEILVVKRGLRIEDLKTTFRSS